MSRDKCDRPQRAPRLERFRSEEEFSNTWDRCVTDMLVKMTGGVVVGSLFSLFLFSRHPFPIYFGFGIGFGMAFNNCQNAFNGPARTFQALCAAHQLKNKAEAKM